LQELLMWIADNRARYDRSQLRYPSDLTDEEMVTDRIPDPGCPVWRQQTDSGYTREVMNGLMYVLGTGCQWRVTPKDLPPRSTLNCYFYRWQHDGTLDRLHPLYVLCCIRRP